MNFAASGGRNFGGLDHPVLTPVCEFNSTIMHASSRGC